MAGFIEATIAERVEISAELAIIKVMPPSPIAFTPGQFVRLGLSDNGRIAQRSYTITSAPHEPLMEFFLELVPDGKLTPMLWELEPGDTLLLHDRAAGVFTLDRKSGAARHLMAATVTGAAPYISMIRAHLHGLATGRAADDIRLALIHGAGVSGEFGPYLDELRNASDDGWLAYIPTVSRPLDDPEWAGEVGLVEDVIRKYADVLGFNHMDAAAYAAGHPRMIENVRGILTRACFTKQQIHTEKYFPLK